MKPAGILWFDDPPETVPVLTSDEIVDERINERAGKIGTVMILAAVIGCLIGVLWAYLGGVL